MPKRLLQLRNDVQCIQGSTVSIVNCGDPNYKTIQFEWFLTDWCNFKCSYCSEFNNMETKFSKETSPGLYKLALARLKRLNAPFTVEIIGGEPTLHPELNEILAALNDTPNCQQVEVVTNLSRSLDFYKSIDYPKVSFLASFHPEHHDMSFLEKAELLKDTLSVTLNLIDDPRFWDLTLDIINELSTRQIKYDVNLLSSTSEYSVNYTEEFFDKFNHVMESTSADTFAFNFDDGSSANLSASVITKDKLHHLRGYKCAPKRYRITHTGEIYNLCTSKKMPIVANTLYEPVICNVSECSCDAMYIFFKERP